MHFSLGVDFLKDVCSNLNAKTGSKFANFVKEMTASSSLVLIKRNRDSPCVLYSASS